MEKWSHISQHSLISSFFSLGNMWRGGLPSLRLQVSEVPRHGWLVESDEHRLRPGAEILPSLLTTQSYLKYLHDDSETKEDSLSFSLWLVTTGGNTSSSLDTPTPADTSTWLLNITLPIGILPVNDQAFKVILPKAPIAPVVQVSSHLIGSESHAWLAFMATLTEPDSFLPISPISINILYRPFPPGWILFLAPITHLHTLFLHFRTIGES
jgi:hypothetical protein